LYARLYVFLKRPDKIRSPYSNSPTGQSYDSSYKKKATGFLRKLSGGEKESPADQPMEVNGNGTGNRTGNGNQIGIEVKDYGNTNHHPDQDPQPQPSEPVFNRDNRPAMLLPQTQFNETTSRPSSVPVSPMSEIPPWERLELPVFQVDGQRYGGPSQPTRSETMFGGWKGMNSKKRPSTATSTGSNNNPQPQSPVLVPMPLPFPRSSVSHSQTHNQNIARGSDGTETTRSRQPSSDTTLVSDRPGDEKRIRKPSTTASNSSSTNYNYYYNNHLQTGLSHTHSRRPSAVPPHASPVMETDNEDLHRSRSRSDTGGELDEESRRQSGRDTDDEDEDESDGEMDLMRMLAQDSEPLDQRRGSKEEYELVPESMASYLNRKTALLMLWFPLGVSPLFFSFFPL